MNPLVRSLVQYSESRDLWEKEIKLYPKGILSRRRPTRLALPCVGSSRGTIKGFSRHSLLRLRQTLLISRPSVSLYSQLGVTLTLPWRVSVDSDEVFNKVTSDYKKVFNQFATSFRRRFSGSVAIFRHELQIRRVPHCHIVLYLSDFDFKYVSRGRSATASDFRAIVWSMWLHALDGYGYYINLKAFHKRGVKIECLSDDLAIFRYLADHSSKNKKSQLGYHGKQWGILNKRLIAPAAGDVVSFDDLRSKQVFFRHVGRLVRFFVPSKCLFGRKLSRPFGKRSVIFVDRRSSRKILVALNEKRIC